MCPLPALARAVCAALRAASVPRCFADRRHDSVAHFAQRLDLRFAVLEHLDHDQAVIAHQHRSAEVADA